ncbi:MAG: hypothetical protein ABEJ83_00435 [Candidatus Nanohaloarchaea archaeon]
MKRKGLSQVLWLIIAAAVLMMVSMALTFTTQGVLGDFASSSSENQCKQTINNQITASFKGDTFTVPGSCLSDDGNPVTPELQSEDAAEGNYVCIESQDASYADTGTWSIVDTAGDCSP